MMIPDLLSWLYAGAHLFVTLGFLRALFRSLYASKLELFGHTVSADSPGRPEENYCTIMLRSGENAPIYTPFVLEVALERAGARFIDPPALHCGLWTRYSRARVLLRKDPRDPRSEATSADGAVFAVFRVDIERLRARDTWVIKFKTDATAGHVVCRLYPNEAFRGAESPAPLIEPMELRLVQRNRIRSSVSPSGLAILVGGLCALLYLYPVLHPSLFPFSIGSAMPAPSWWDVVAVVAIGLFGWRVFTSSTARLPTPFVQGYRRDAMKRERRLERERTGEALK